MVENEMRLVIPSHSSNESFVRIAVSGFFAQLDPTVDEITEIKTAVSEAITNAIVHAYKNKIGKIHIQAKIFTGRKVTVRIRDTGCGIVNVEKAMEPMYTTCNNGERSGLGFSVMQTFMDKVQVKSREGKGTTVAMTKVLSSRDKA